MPCKLLGHLLRVECTGGWKLLLPADVLGVSIVITDWLGWVTSMVHAGASPGKSLLCFSRLSISSEQVHLLELLVFISQSSARVTKVVHSLNLLLPWLTWLRCTAGHTSLGMLRGWVDNGLWIDPYVHKLTLFADYRLLVKSLHRTQIWGVSCRALGYSSSQNRSGTTSVWYLKSLIHSTFTCSE